MPVGDKGVDPRRRGELLVSHDEKNIKAAVNGIADIATIPVTLKRILEVVDDEGATRGALVSVIEHDQALASKIVSMANSAFYGFSGKVTNISSAAVVLGFNMIRNLAVSVSLFKPSSGADLGYLTNLWRHSFEVAVASGLLADRTGLIRKEDAFLAGLINDLGRVLLYQIHGGEYLKAAAGPKEGLLEREKAAFGATHSQVGAWFADTYKFQKECVLAIQLHHEPEKFLKNYHTGSLAMVPIVYLADYVVSDGRKGPEIDLVPSSGHDEIMESVYLDDAGLREVKEELGAQEEDIKAFFSF